MVRGARFKQVENQRVKNNKLEKLGLCKICGKEKERDDRKTCNVCLEKSREYHKIKKIKKLEARLNEN